MDDKTKETLKFAAVAVGGFLFVALAITFPVAAGVIMAAFPNDKEKESEDKAP